MFKWVDCCNHLRCCLIAAGVALPTVVSRAAPVSTAPAQASIDAIAALTAADKSLSQGTIVYSRESTNETSSRYDGKLIYLSDGRFEEDLNFPEKDTHSVTYWDGENAISQTKMVSIPGNYISINPTQPPQFLPNADLLTVRPGPSFVLGRGLSLLKNLHVVSASSNSMTVMGTYVDGSTPVTASLDPRNDFLATRIEVDFRNPQAHKTLSAVWIFGPPLKSSSRQIIASSATYEVPAVNLTDHYVIQRANFARPTLSIPTSIPAGDSVADMRAGRKINLFLAQPQTLDQILLVTRRRAAELAAQDAQDRALEAAFQRRSVVLRVLMIVLAATVVAQLVIVWRRRKHPAGAA